MTETPRPSLGDVMQRARTGSVSKEQLFRAFLEATVVLPSATDPTSGAVTPVLTDVDGITYMAVAADQDALGTLGTFAKYSVVLTGQQVIAGVASDVGVVVESFAGAVAFDSQLIASVRATNT